MAKVLFEVGDEVTWVGAEQFETDIITGISGDELHFADGKWVSTCWAILVKAKDTPVSNKANVITTEDKLSLRDHFAALAMQGLIGNDLLGYGQVAEHAYLMADRMMEARNGN